MIALPTVLFALLVGATPALAQDTAHSTPEDRQRFVAVEHNLERDPLNPDLRDDRAWATRWLIDAPDVTVHVCAGSIGGISEKGYPHTSLIIVQYSLAMAAFIIEHPDKQNDQNAQQLAGVEGALKAYQALRTAQPDKKSPALENLLGMQSRGELPAFVQKAYAECRAKG